MIRRLLYVSLFASVMPSPAPAADQFILNAPCSQVPAIAAENGLTLLRRIPNQCVFLVRGPEGVPPQVVIDAVEDDDDDRNLELNVTVVLPELVRGPRLIGSTRPVTDALNNRNLVPFYGDLVWNGFPNQPAAILVRVAATQQEFSSGTGTVAVIDSGIDPNHLMLRNHIVPGYDFTREQAGLASEILDLTPNTVNLLNQYPLDLAGNVSSAILNPSTMAILDAGLVVGLDPRTLPPAFGHGTMVAGLVHLVAPTAKIMPLKAFRGNGTATLFNILRAIYFAQANGARVINMSLSMTTPSDALTIAIDFVSARNVVCIASAGNSGRETLVWPSALAPVFGVASTTITDARSTFTNFGDPVVRMAAPGEAMITAYPLQNYAAGWGTSFAAPLVAGAAAMLLDLHPDLDWREATAALSKTQPAAEGLGWGRLDLYLALTEARARQ